MWVRLSYPCFAMYPRNPRSDVDQSLSPPPRSSVRTACARIQAHPSPAPVIWPMDTG